MQTKIFMRVVSKKVCHMGKEFTCGRMVRDIKDNFALALGMGKDC